ncbi:hypothetical protein F5B17DRAFT_153183 [Nemania serpens]|nr:hypothetical protein F5B17DRAFT_153183 [Nemania serpens]
MCRGTKIEMNCGHVQTHFRALCGQKCSSPQGSTTYLDRPCPRCDPENTKKNLGRVVELMAQLRPQESLETIQQLADAGRQINLNMRRNIAEARYLAYGTTTRSTADHDSPSAPRDESYTAGRSWGGRAPWEDSESDSDSGRRDTTRLSEDMKHVIEKKYKLIAGHLSLISYRRELDEVDPDLLAKLRAKREKELAKERRKEEKRRARADGNKKPESYKATVGGDKRGERLATIDGVEGSSPKQRIETPATPPPSPNAINIALTNPRHRNPSPRQVESVKEAHARMQEAFASPPANPRHRNPSPRQVASVKEAHARMQKALASSPASSNSFRARTEQDGFLAPPFEEATREHGWGFLQAESSATGAKRTLRRSRAQVWTDKFADDITYDDGGDDADVSDSDSIDSCITVYASPSYGKNRVAEGEEEDLDVWQMIADEDEDEEGGAPLRRQAGRVKK